MVALDKFVLEGVVVVSVAHEVDEIIVALNRGELASK